MNRKPLDTTKENIFLFFNEFTVFMYLCCLISLSDYNLHTEHFNFLGMCLLSVVIIALGVNFMKFFVNFLGFVYRFLRKYICNDNCCINYEKKKDENVVAIRPTTTT